MQARALLALGAPIAAITIVGISMSLTYPLFALRLERMGESGAVIGLSATAAALGMVVGAPLMPRLLERVGIGPLMYGALGVLIGIFALIQVHENVWFWTLLRVVYGFSATALFFSSEFWIVGNAPDHLRGRVVAVYALALAGGFALGPAILGLTGYEGWPPILIAAAVCISGALPIALGLASSPPRADAPNTESGNALSFVRSDPTLMASVVLFGMIEFGAMALLPVWAIRSGLGEDVSITLLVLLALGAMAAQLPVGWAADKMNRRRLLTAAGLGNALVCIALPLAVGTAWLVQVLALLWGAIAVTLYSVALVELGARYRGAALAAGMAAIVGAYGVGALVSPWLFGFAMDVVPPHGLLFALLGFTAFYLALIAFRARRAGFRLTRGLPRVGNGLRNSKDRDHRAEGRVGDPNRRRTTAGRPRWPSPPP